MIETVSQSASTRRRRKRLASLVLALLSIPAIAILFGDAVDWTSFDFAAAAVLLTTAAVSYEVLIATHIGRRHQYFCAAVVIVILMLARGSQI